MSPATSIGSLVSSCGLSAGLLAEAPSKEAAASKESLGRKVDLGADYGYIVSDLAGFEAILTDISVEGPPSAGFVVLVVCARWGFLVCR